VGFLEPFATRVQDPTRPPRGGKQVYYGDSQRVWPLTRLTCTDAKIASLHLIAPVITAIRYPALTAEEGVTESVPDLNSM
jgi:hypothetical protein